MHFEENQLSPGSIGISPLPTVHRLSLQPKSVRASTKFYLRFTLTMGRSPGFGSTARDFHLLRGNALFRLAFAAAPGVSPLASPRTVTRRLILQKARHQPVRRIAPTNLGL